MRLVALLVTLGLAAAVGACGSDEKSEGDGDAARKQAEEFRQRGEEICRDVVEREIRMEARIQEAERRGGGGPAATDRLTARLFRRYEGFVEELAKRLGTLEPQAPDKRALRAYLAHLDRIAEKARSTSEFLGAGRSREAVAGFGEIATELEKADEAAERLKLAPCTELSNPALTGEA